MPDGAKTPEAQLLSNVRGIIAEFERAKILERTARGRRAGQGTSRMAAARQAIPTSSTPARAPLRGPPRGSGLGAASFSSMWRASGPLKALRRS